MALIGSIGDYVRQRIAKDLNTNRTLKKYAGHTKKKPATVADVLSSKKASKYFFNPFRFKRVLQGIQRQVNKGNIAPTEAEVDALIDTLVKANPNVSQSFKEQLDRLKESLKRVEVVVDQYADGLHFEVNEELRDIIGGNEEFYKWIVDDKTTGKKITLPNFASFINLINPLKGYYFLNVERVSFENTDDKSPYFRTTITK